VEHAELGLPGEAAARSGGGGGGGLKGKLAAIIAPVGGDCIGSVYHNHAKVNQ
jgi:hypothetical protein